MQTATQYTSGSRLTGGILAADTAFVVPIGVGFDISDTSWTWGAVVDFFAGTASVVCSIFNSPALNCVAKAPGLSPKPSPHPPNHAGVLFFMDVSLGFHTGYVVTNNFSKRVVMDGKLVARWYVTRGSFIVDFLSSLAWVTQVSLPALQSQRSSCVKAGCGAGPAPLHRNSAHAWTAASV